VHNVDQLMRVKRSKEEEIPMKKGKLIQPPRLLSCASFEDASSLPSIVALHLTSCLVLFYNQIGVLFIEKSLFLLSS
jgi:hypothetical protein